MFKRFLILSGIVMVPALVLLAYSELQVAEAENESSYSEVFSTTLTGDKEVPPVTTSAHGTSEYHVKSDGSGIHYVLKVEDIQNVTGAHLHCALPGVAGPIIAPLTISTTGSTTQDIETSGMITQADIAATAMNCSPNINTLPHLVQAMREGVVYVNVHTTQHPMGEIRGQLMHGENMMTNPGTTTPGTATSTPTDTATSTATTTNPTNTNTSSTSGWYYVFVAPDSYYKNQGDTVRFNGNHFSPNETVNVYMNGTMIHTVQADASGNFSTAGYMIPYTSGTQTFMFKGMSSNIPYSVNVSVSGGNAWITLSNYYSGAGSTVTIEGNSFGSYEMVNVSFNGSSMGTAQADAQGRFSHTITIPSGWAGVKSVVATGQKTGIVATQNFSQAF